MRSSRADTRHWLPAGRTAAVCLSVDDVHPGRSSDHYEAGGDLGAGVLGRLARLLERHPPLRATLFVTPDWRERSPVPTRSRLARIAVVRDHAHLTPPLPRGTMRLDRHPTFVEYLRRGLFEIAVHGLNHLARGPRPPYEFERSSHAEAQRRLRRARAIFAAAGLEPSAGFCPPGWELPAALEHALVREGFRWVSAARDIHTPIARDARTAMSGPLGLSLLTPQTIARGRLVHLPVNFQATSDDARADAILACGGLLSIKAHAVADACGHIALDALDDAYCDRLDVLFDRLRARHGDGLWWTTMEELANHVWEQAATLGDGP